MWRVAIIIAFIVPQLLTASEYTNTTLSCLHKHSDLRAVVAEGFNASKYVDLKFLTVGLESSGHHLVESLSSVLPGTHNIGGQESFPQNNCKRLNLDSAECNPALTMRHWKENKYLVILRSPLPQFKSVLSRFWHYGNIVLSEMYDMWLSAASQMHIFVTGLIAMDKPIFVVVYENLLNNPAAHVDVFTTFLGCNRSAIETWVESFHAPTKKTDVGKILRKHAWGRWEKPKSGGYEEALDAHFNKYFDGRRLNNAFPRY